MKVLILHPDFQDPGGVAAHYRKLSGKFAVPVGHMVIGMRPEERGLRNKAHRMIGDLRRFRRKIRNENYTLVHVNPSLDPKSLIRDGLFVLAAKAAGTKAVVFFHGWNLHYERQIQTHWRWLFRRVFGCADAFIVLSEAFKSKLGTWIGSIPIYCEFTTLDDNDLLGFDIAQVLEERFEAKTWRILFISRLLKEKGLYETIETARLLNDVPLELIVAGDGPELEPARAYVSRKGPDNVRFVGYVRGEEKLKLLRKSHFLCFPSYSEGMPNTVIEAMGFGLPVITRPVGGLADFFKNGVHGFSTVSKDPQMYAGFIRTMLEDQDLYRTIAMNNFNFAQTQFKASRAVRRMERIYASLFDGEAESKAASAPSLLSPPAKS
jgi:glycosyltransferase involved in cell wall biosynthesis